MFWHHNKTKGFTLIEILLSVSLISVLLFSVSGFLTLMFESRQKSQSMMEVEENGIQIVQTLTQVFRNADTIVSPAVGASGTSASVTLTNSLLSPTVFTFADERLSMTEGGGTPIYLSSTRVRVSDFVVENISRVGTPGTLRIQFTLTSLNSSQRNEYDFTKTFYASATLR